MQELVTVLQGAHKVAIIGHIRPDGDAAASVLGLYQVLLELEKSPVAVLKDGVPVAFSFLDGSDKIVTELPDDLDLCIVVDSPDAVRTGYADLVRAYAEAGKLILIDHHAKGDLLKRASATLYNPDVSSTAELVYELTVALGVKISPNLATCLLTGMYTDTGGFQYGNTTNATLERAAELLRRGAKLNLIVQQVARQRSVAGLKLLGIALSRLALTPDKRGAITTLSLSDLEACDAVPEDASGLVNALNVLPEVAYCLLLTELEPGLIRGTLRSTTNSFDVAEMAKVFGGGGHPRAAGFALSGKLVVREKHWRIESDLVAS